MQIVEVVDFHVTDANKLVCTIGKRFPMSVGPPSLGFDPYDTQAPKQKSLFCLSLGD